MRKAVRLKERIATLKDQMRRLEGRKLQMKASADGQVSLTDPTPGRWRAEAKVLES